MSDSLDGMIASAFDPRYLELILLPTERCNFRCTYCYEDFGLGKMPKRVVDAIKLLLRARAGDLDTLHLSWFGGEPLVARDIVLDLNNFAKREYAGRDFSSSITTNGYFLNRTLFDELVESGARHFQISLDGPKAEHDKTRVTVGGKGTFDTIMKNLIDTKGSSADFAVSLRVHVSGDNVAQVPLLIDQLVSEFGGDARYELFVKEVSRLGGPNDDSISLVAQDRFHELVSSIQKRCNGSMRVEWDEPGRAHVCYAARLNSLLIRSDGRIGKCTVALGDAQNVIGLLNDNGSLTLDRDKLLHWTGGLFTGDPAQLACPWSSHP